MRSFTKIGHWFVALLIIGSLGLVYYWGVKDADRIAQRKVDEFIKSYDRETSEANDRLYEMESFYATELAKARADNSNLREHFDRLRDQLSTCPSPHTQVDLTNPADQTEGVRTFVLSEITDRLEILAEFADESYVAAVVCNGHTDINEDLRLRLHSIR